GLTPGLADAVELAGVEVIAADQGTNRAVARVDGHQTAVDRRHLAKLPLLLRVAGNADEVARLGDFLRRARRRTPGIVVDEALGPADAVPRELDGFAVATQGGDAALVDRDGEGGLLPGHRR